MESNVYIDIKTFIAKDLLNNSFLKKTDFSRELFKKIIRSGDITKIIHNIFNNGLFTCTEALELASEIFRLYYKNSSDLWFMKLEESEQKNLIYNYNQSILYPHTLDKRYSDYVNSSQFQILFDLYIQILRVFINNAKINPDNKWEYLYPYNNLDLNDYKKSRFKKEYQGFIDAFEKQNVYGLMKMSQEWKGFTSLDHTLGVYNLCMFIGRQMKKLGFPVDLAILSAAAIGHDIGKYGCYGEELKRIAYYHYFYTKEWYDKNRLYNLSHYATNHSTWDLEELRLPNETIILIYSDFRVKTRYNEDGSSNMDIFSNEESFEVIKNKLDNLDEEKLNRYRRVYRKLEDLERMFISLGINTNIKKGIKEKDYGQRQSRFNAICIVNGNVNSDFIGILPNNEILNAIKTLTVAHNTFVMDKMRDAYSLKILFEDARQEKTKSDLRIYLSIIEEYSDFFTLEQRELCINFLFGLLNHPDDDIRYHSADSIGKFVAEMREAYTRYLPPGKTHMVIDKSEKYLNNIFALLDFIEPSDPEGYLTEKKMYNITIAIRKLLKTARDDKKEEFETIIIDRIMERSKKAGVLSLMYLIEVISDSCASVRDDIIIRTAKLLLNSLTHKDIRIRLMSIRALINFSKRPLWNDFLRDNWKDIIDSFNYLLNNYNSPTELYSLSKLYRSIDNDTISSKISEQNKKKLISIFDDIDIRPIFLRNLKTSTPWIEKKTNCLFLVEIAQRLKTTDPESSLIVDIAVHLSNILKVSQYEGTRFQAGSSLLELSSMLNFAQLNEISIELLRTLEQESLGFTHYIPRVLGQIIAKLPMDEFIEIYADIKEKLKIGSPHLKELYLKTLSIILSHINPDIRINQNAELKILGLLTGALCDTDKYTKQKANYIIGSRIFKSRFLSSENKQAILYSSLKKILSLISNSPKNYIDLFYTASMLNNIYRFISNFEFECGELDLPKDKKVAFFPGTFDPFSLSHLEIIKNCQKEGFDIYIQVDEFSWRKRTLPPALRKNIIRLSTSHLLNAFIYPEIPPINLANQEDLKRLLRTFRDRELYLVAGADVIANATAYQQKDNSLIKEINHYIIYRKDSHGKSIQNKRTFKKALKGFKGKLILKELHDTFHYINSTSIRDLIDRDESIDHLVDARSANYIRDNNLYIRQPEVKQNIELWDFKIETIKFRESKSLRNIPKNILNNIIAKKKRYNNLYDIQEDLMKKDARLFIVRKASNNNEIIALFIYYKITDEGIFGIIRDPMASKFQRNNTYGKIAFIDSVYIERNHHIFSKSRFHLHLIKEGYLFALQEIDQDLIRENNDPGKIEKLERTYNKLLGYYQVPYDYTRGKMAINLNIVDLRKPVLFINNIDDVLKAPYNNHPLLKKRFRKNRESTLRILSKINKESVIISLDYKDIVFNIIEKITQINNESPKNQFLCILFGNILGRYIVPNTITKALHAERVVNSTGKLIGFTHSKHYYSIPIQLKTIKAFGKKPILSDIIVHSARRILNIKKSGMEIGINIDRVVSGVISGLAKEIMEANDIRSESIFYIPRLHSWYEEHNFYPYAGGDSILEYIDIEEPFNRAMIYILPFCPYEQQYNATLNDRIVFSQNCLENAYGLFKDIEEIYLENKKKNLILQNIQEILENPRLPVYNPLLLPDNQKMLTKLIKKDLETLGRYYTIA